MTTSVCQHRDVISELKKSASQYGIGTGSSPLITGYTQSHQYLEKEICGIFRHRKLYRFKQWLYG